MSFIRSLFHFETGIILDDSSIINLVLEMCKKRSAYLEYMNHSTPQCSKGVRIEFTSIYRNTILGEVNWRIDFSLHSEDVVTIRGYNTEELLELIFRPNNEVVFSGDRLSMTRFKNSERFKHLSEWEFNQLYAVNRKIRDHYKSILHGVCAQRLCGINIEYKPNN